jgi:hypothetical protein
VFRDLASKVTLTLVSIAVALAVIELALRVMGYEPRKAATVNPGLDSWSQPSAEMGWVNRPGIWLSAEAGHVPMRFERDGRRFDPVDKKAASFPKVLVVGCSFTQGAGIADNETYSHLVNQALSSVEVLNFGTGGYGAYQSLLRIREYFRNPHDATPLVIYGLFYGHHIRDIAPLAWIMMLSTGDGSYMVPPNLRVVSGKMVESPGGLIAHWPLETYAASVALLHQIVMRRALGSHRVDFEMAAQVFHHGIQEMARTVAQNNAKLLVVGLTLMPSEDLAWLRSQREPRGIDFIDCHHPDFAADPGLQVGGAGHPNDRMHRYWADCIVKALKARGYDLP